MKLHLPDFLLSRVYFICICFIGLLALAFVPHHVQGQSVPRHMMRALSGLTVDSAHHALAGVSIQLISPGDTTSAELAISDSAGRFMIKLAHGGTYRLMGSHVGYKSIEIRPIDFESV